MYRGRVGVLDEGLAEDHVWGFESQLEVSQFLFQSEWARGNSLGQTRTGYYVQPAYRIDEDWITFYRWEQLESPRIQRAERRHLAGVNYRPYPQIALKGELYRSLPLERDFLHSEGEEESKALQRYRAGGGVLLLIAVVRRFADGGVDRSDVDGARVHADHPVRRHRQQRESGNVAHDGRAAAHLHEAVSDVAARRTDGAGRLGQHALHACGLLEGCARPDGSRDAGLLGAAVDDAGR